MNEPPPPPPPVPPMPVPAMASLMSRPEQKPLPAPVRMTTRTSPSSSAWEKCSLEQLEHPDRDGVAAVGPVEGDGGDVVGHLVQDLGAVALVRFGAGGVGHNPTR